MLPQAIDQRDTIDCRRNAMARSNQTKQDPVVAARAIARAEVARHWPELADIEPTVAPRQRYLPDAAELAGLAPPAQPRLPLPQWPSTPSRLPARLVRLKVS